MHGGLADADQGSTRRNALGLPAHIIQIRMAGVMIDIEPRFAQNGGYAALAN
jgi:hypothetical protein